jgi:hypothetical protein
MICSKKANNDTSTCAQVSVAYSGVTEAWKEVPKFQIIQGCATETWII